MLAELFSVLKQKKGFMFQKKKKIGSLSLFEAKQGEEEQTHTNIKHGFAVAASYIFCFTANL